MNANILTYSIKLTTHDKACIAVKIKIDGAPISGGLDAGTLQRQEPDTGELDGWLDVAVRPDGRPAAVWFDADEKSLKLYAP